jgi:hypothetical protein
MSNKSVGIISIATNNYIEYWHDQVNSIAKNCDSQNRAITIHLFTDQPQKAKEISSSLPQLKFRINQIPSLTWPEATLFRFRLMEAAQDSLTDEILVYLDADMLVMSDFIESIPENLKSGIGLVKHPGYFRPKGWKLLLLYATNFKLLLSDFRSYLVIGGLGSWEMNQQYRAYVPRKLRKNYVCGGTWLGFNTEFLNMVSKLSLIERADTSIGLIPRWHDESILNWWNAFNAPTLLSSSYCYDPSYPQLKLIPEYIRAVNKNV